MDTPLQSRKQMPEFGMETLDITGHKGVKKSTIGEKSHVERSLGMHKSQFWNNQEKDTTVDSVPGIVIFRDWLKPTI
jgi:hypothetical protein